MTDNEKLRLIKELSKNDGWSLAKETLLVSYSYWVTKLAKDRSMTREDTEYARGVIYAIEYLSSLPALMEKQVLDKIALTPKVKPKD